MVSLSALQLHQHTLIVVDDPATIELKVKTVKYFKDLETIATENGLAQIICPEAETEEEKNGIREELDSSVEGSPREEKFLAEPKPTGTDYIRALTPELRPDPMSSRLGAGPVNGFGGLQAGEVGELPFQSMGSRVAPLAG